MGRQPKDDRSERWREVQGLGLRSPPILEAAQGKHENERELAFKRAVQRLFYNGLALYVEGFYNPTMRQLVDCSFLALLLYMWKKQRISYTDLHNLPFHRVLEWFPLKEEVPIAMEELEKVTRLDERYGDYMEVIEDNTDYIQGVGPNRMDLPVYASSIVPDVKMVGEFQAVAKEMIQRVDRSLVDLMEHLEA